MKQHRYYSIWNDATLRPLGISGTCNDCRSDAAALARAAKDARNLGYRGAVSVYERSLVLHAGDRLVEKE